VKTLCCLLLALAAGCASTVQHSWKDPAFAGPAFKKLLVIGVSRSVSNRRAFEQRFVAALQGAGVDGVVSYELIPAMDERANQRVAEAVAKAGAEGALVTRILRVRREAAATPGYTAFNVHGGGYGGWYGGAWTSAPDADVYDVITLETTLWNAKADKPVWSGVSEVADPQSLATATDLLAKVLIEKMKADGVI
jgi:hypothetical protein